MLGSARSSCARTLAVRASSPFCSALPAESSRQALSRSLALASPATLAFPRRHKTAGPNCRIYVKEYSSAAAMAQEEKAIPLPSADFHSPPWPSRSDLTYTPPAQDRPPDPQPMKPKLSLPRPSRSQRQRQPLPQTRPQSQHHPQFITVDLSPLELFRIQATSSPIDALLSLPSLQPEDEIGITAQDLARLFRNITHPPVGSSFGTGAPSGQEEMVRRALAQAVEIFRNLPSMPGAPDRYLGKGFKLNPLNCFLRACVVLGADDLARSVFRERVSTQITTGQIIVLKNPKLVEFLARRRQWTLIIDMFSPGDFPTQLITPQIVEYLLQSHLALNEPFEVTRRFELFTSLNLTATKDSYNHLIQAFLQVGNIDAARAVARKVSVSGISDYSAQQLAIIRGYRSLGHDDNLEKRVLDDISKLGMEPLSAFLNALIQMRMDAGDLDGAEVLLRRFDLDFAEVKGRECLIEPTTETIELAFNVLSKDATQAELRQLWDHVATSPKFITDKLVAVLIQQLARVGLADEAYDMMRLTATSNISPWSLPRGFRPGVESFNSLLEVMSGRDHHRGLRNVTELMRGDDIKPNNQTLSIIIDYARRSLVHSPVDLATLLTDLLKRNPHLKPTVNQVDAIMADAIRAAGRMHRDAQHPLPYLAQPATSNIIEPSAGIKRLDAFRSQMRHLVQSLRGRGATSSSRSLANRLRFDAMTLGSSNIPSARFVWNSLLARGFTPDKVHFLAMMQGYSDAGALEEAEDVCLLAEQTGHQITKAMYMVLLVGWGRQCDTFRARKAYDSIKQTGLDMPAVGAMIQAYYHAKDYDNAAKLIHTDFAQLRASGVPLDDQAVLIAATSLRWQGDFIAALKLISEHGRVNYKLRNVVNQIRNYLEKRGARLGDKEHETLELAKKLLAMKPVGRTGVSTVQGRKSLLAAVGVQPRRLGTVWRKKEAKSD